jgi:hypothetical protein
MIQYGHWVDKLPCHEREVAARGKDSSDDIEPVPYPIYEGSSYNVNALQQEEISGVV